MITYETRGLLSNGPRLFDFLTFGSGLSYPYFSDCALPAALLETTTIVQPIKVPRMKTEAAHSDNTPGLRVKRGIALDSSVFSSAADVWVGGGEGDKLGPGASGLAVIVEAGFGVSGGNEDDGCRVPLAGNVSFKTASITRSFKQWLPEIPAKVFVQLNS
jgi:hypothetical protein